MCSARVLKQVRNSESICEHMFFGSLLQYSQSTAHWFLNSWSVIILREKRGWFLSIVCTWGRIWVSLPVIPIRTDILSISFYKFLRTVLVTYF